jgi:hypothetical protein
MERLWRALEKLSGNRHRHSEKSRKMQPFGGMADRDDGRQIDVPNLRATDGSEECPEWTPPVLPAVAQSAAVVPSGPE